MPIWPESLIYIARVCIAFPALVFAVIGPSPSRAQDTAQPEAKKIYIPSNPRAAAYMLGRLSNKELAQAPRVEPVYNAFLERAGLDVRYREEALAGLASLHKTDRLTELLAAFERLDS